MEKKGETEGKDGSGDKEGWLPTRLAEALSISPQVVTKYMGESAKSKDTTITNLFSTPLESKDAHYLELYKKEEGKVFPLEPYNESNSSKRNKHWTEYFPPSPRMLRAQKIKKQEKVISAQRKKRRSSMEKEETDKLHTASTFLTSVGTGEDDFASDIEDTDSLSSFSEDENNNLQLVLNLDFLSEEKGEDESEDESQELTGRSDYLKRCEENFPSTKPISYFVERLEKEHISLSHRGIDSADADAIAEGLKKNIYVRSLDLSNNCLGGKGANSICKLLKHNKFVSKLDISNNKIGNKGGREIAAALRLNKSLRSLSLSRNNFGDGFAEELSLVLQEDPGKTLTYLNLSENRIGSRGGKALADFLEKNESIAHLNLSWNNFGGMGTKYIIQAIINQQNLDLCHTTLKHLDLSWNGMDDRVAETLGELIKTGRVLEVLDVSHNRLGPKSAFCIAEHLAGNTTVKCLKIGFNALGTDGTTQLLKCLESNRTIRTISVENTTTDGKHGDDQLNEILEIAEQVIEKRGIYAEILVEYPPKNRASVNSRKFLEF